MAGGKTKGRGPEVTSASGRGRKPATVAELVGKPHNFRNAGRSGVIFQEREKRPPNARYQARPSIDPERLCIVD
jgi:hypothetical protein